MLNTQIQNYKILSLLGEGGMATVYLAEHNLLGNQTAFKLLNKEFVYNENIRKRFLAEARSMARMSHSNIVKVTDLIDDGDTVAFVMEYVAGETLKEFIERKGRLSDQEIKNVFSQMLDAVDYVHKQNLVHRDIKPSNFMIDTDGKVKLMDFGIAKTTETTSPEYTQTGTGVQMGTPMYMSPEQITATKSVTPQSDIYSLGVVLWQMVTGQKPYDTKTLSTFQLQMKIVQEELPKTNTRWDLIISKSTRKDIVDRLENCSIFKDFFLNKEQNNISENINDTTEKTIIKSEFHQDSNIINHYQKDGNKTIFETDYYVGQMIDNGVVYKYDRENKFLFLCNLQIINKYNWFEAQNQENSDWILPQISDLEILYKHKKDLKLIREELYWSKSEDYFRNGWAYSFEKGERIVSAKNLVYNVLLIKKIKINK